MREPERSSVAPRAAPATCGVPNGCELEPGQVVDGGDGSPQDGGVKP
jgi:hypothetical protein